MSQIKHVVIVGGGTAGWITAGTLAAEHGLGDSPLKITLVESPDINPIGVGEGTWPSMRSTLQKMGVSETDFIRECDASFKQGSKFCGWVNGGAGDEYFHPFTLPAEYQELNLAGSWQRHRDEVTFADAVCPQSQVSLKDLAPKQISTPEWAFNLNYGYHLDAGKFSAFLKRHCLEKLNVDYVSDNVVGVNSSQNGDIASVSTEKNGPIKGDLFIDCTGFASLLIGKHYDVPFKEKHDILFNDTALAVQVPYLSEDSPIASCTVSTAQEVGWIWDIGLPTRRGVGHVYSSRHCSDDQAEAALRRYIEPSFGGSDHETVSLRKIKIKPGYRSELWHKNCLAVGIAAGFLEPLEASALVLIELSAKMLSEQFPVNREAMNIVARRFNETFNYRWERIIDFLKLHYVLTERKENFWQDNCDPDTIPDSLSELLRLWEHQFPWRYDTPFAEEMFPSASYQYVLYGMGFETKTEGRISRSQKLAMERANGVFQQNVQRTQQLLRNLPTNRDLLNKIYTHGFHKI